MTMSQPRGTPEQGLHPRQKEPAPVTVASLACALKPPPEKHHLTIRMKLTLKEELGAAAQTCTSAGQGSFLGERRGDAATSAKCTLSVKHGQELPIKAGLRLGKQYLSYTRPREALGTDRHCWAGSQTAEFF